MGCCTAFYTLNMGFGGNIMFDQGMDDRSGLTFANPA